MSRKMAIGIVVVSLLLSAIVCCHDTPSPVPIYIDRDGLKQYTAAGLAEYTHNLNEDMKKRAR